MDMTKALALLEALTSKCPKRGKFEDICAYCGEWVALVPGSSYSHEHATDCPWEIARRELTEAKEKSMSNVLRPNQFSLTEVGKSINGAPLPGEPTEAYRVGKLLFPFVPKVQGYEDWK